MKQYEVVEIITKEFSRVPEVKFICLDGSLIIQEEDSFSDINYTIGIDFEYYDRFVAKILDCLERYDTIIFYKSYDKYHYTFVYDHGIILKLTLTDIHNINLPNKYCVLYDYESRLNNIEVSLNKLSDVEMADMVNEISLNLLDFKKAFLRKDVVYAMSLVSNMINQTAMFLRAIDNPNNANYSLNKCFDLLSKEHKIEFAKMIKEYRYNTLLPCTQLLVMLLSENIQTLSIDIAQHINYDLFDYAKKELFLIERK